MAIVSGSRDYPLDFFLQPMKPAKPPKTKSAPARLEKAFISDEYVAEEKLDGCHYFAIGGRIFAPRISDIDGLPVEKTNRVPHIQKTLEELGPNVILDGEIYIPGRKSSNIVSIMGSDPDVAIAKQRDDQHVRYCAFDILRDTNGTWLFDVPLWQRRRRLEELLRDNPECRAHIDIPEWVFKNKKKFLDDLLAQGKEGIVLKHIQSEYVLGKRPAWKWIKLKAEIDDDVVIMGFEPPKKVYEGIDTENWLYWYHPESASCWHGINNYENLDQELSIPVTRYFYNGWIGKIVIGKYDKHPDEGGKLVRLGTTSGMDDSMRKEFSEHPEKYIGRVIKIKAMERTGKDLQSPYRHSRFKCLHEDKNAFECILGKE